MGDELCQQILDEKRALYVMSEKLKLNSTYLAYRYLQPTLLVSSECCMMDKAKLVSDEGIW